MSAVDRYTVLEPLGRGGMCRVDLARRSVPGAGVHRLVAIKRLHEGAAADPRAVLSLLDEARVGSVLTHPNVAHVYEVGRIGGEAFVAMEFVAGASLREVLRAGGRRGVPPRIALTLVARVLDGLGYAHARTDPLGRPLGIVHRDVNPRNVLVSVSGEVKLIDFGVASAVDRLEHTQVGEVKGKFGYMAPEQLGDGAVDARTDVFAVGLLLFELLTGRAPFAGLSASEQIRRSIAAEVPPLPDDFRILSRLYRRATAGRPDDRFASAEDFREHVTTKLSLLGGEATASDIATWLASVAPGEVERATARILRNDASWPRPNGPSLEAFLPARRAEVAPWRDTLVMLGVLAVGVATLLVAIP